MGIRLFIIHTIIIIIIFEMIRDPFEELISSFRVKKDAFFPKTGQFKERGLNDTLTARRIMIKQSIDERISRIMND